MKRVLLIDNSVESQNEVRKALESQFKLSFASTLNEARSETLRNEYDVILLEAILPDGEGFNWCVEYRNQGAVQVPVIFLTHRGSLSDKARAFNGGADDYLIKPFDPVELELRVKARLRSALGNQQEQNIQCGDLTLNVPYQKAVLNEGGVEKDLRLTPTEFRLLYFFIKNENTILTRDQLLSTIWSDDVHVLTRTIDKHISTLKKKLGNRSNAIQSVHSRGYRFTQVRLGNHDSQSRSYVSMLSQ